MLHAIYIVLRIDVIVLCLENIVDVVFVVGVHLSGLAWFDVTFSNIRLSSLLCACVSARECVDYFYIMFYRW